MTRPRRPRAWRSARLGPGLLVMVGLGCGVAQRPSLAIVDPQLKAEGVAHERVRMKGGFKLGPFDVSEVGIRSEAPDPDGPLAREDVPRPVTQHRAGLRLASAERSWVTACRLQRRAPPAADYRAVLDENGDEIAVDCTAKTAGRPPWRFTARALLSGNFVGQLGPEDGDGWTVEVLTRAQRFKRIERVLPVPVAQLRQDDRVVLAMLLGRPEKAWVDPTVEPIHAEATLALLLTLRFLPWELAQ